MVVGIAALVDGELELAGVAKESVTPKVTGRCGQALVGVDVVLEESVTLETPWTCRRFSMVCATVDWLKVHAASVIELGADEDPVELGLELELAVAELAALESELSTVDFGTAAASWLSRSDH